MKINEIIHGFRVISSSRVDEVDGTLYDHLEEIDRICNERIETMVTAMKKQQGITEELKARDQLAWVGAMNNIRNVAEEIVLRELIYEEDGA